MTAKEKAEELESDFKFERLEKHLFIGKVMELIGDEKAIKLLKEAKAAIQQLKHEINKSEL